MPLHVFPALSSSRLHLFTFSSASCCISRFSLLLLHSHPPFCKIVSSFHLHFIACPPPPPAPPLPFLRELLKPHQHDTEHTVDTVFGHYRMYTANSTYHRSALICITCLRARNVIVGHYARCVQPRVSDILGEIILAARRLRPFRMRSREAPIGRPRRRARHG